MSGAHYKEENSENDYQNEIDYYLAVTLVTNALRHSLAHLPSSKLARDLSIEKKQVPQFLVVAPDGFVDLRQ